MQKIKLLMLFMIFAGSMLAQQDTSLVYVHGNVYNLGENTVIVDVVLSDGQSASALTWGSGYYFVEFEFSENGTIATSSTTNCEGDIVSNSGQVEFFGSVQLDLNYCGNEILGGCMDTAANNYDENATYDDGSCDYCDNTDAVLYVCTFSNGADVGIQILGDGEVVFEQYGFNNGEIAYIPICLEDSLCYEVKMSNSQSTGWYGGYYWIQVNGFEIANEFLDADLATEMDTFSVYGDVCPSAGCTNPDALNYDSEAEVDDGSCIIMEDCDGTLVIIEIETGEFAEEMSWYITNSDSANVLYSQLYQEDNSIYYDYACLEDGCYQLHMFDGFGDGWNGGNISVSANGVEIAFGQIVTGNYVQVVFGINSECDEVIGGCTDPSAENYNSEATYEDGSCTYIFECNCTEEYDPVCALTYDIFSGDSIAYTFANACWAECSGALILFDGPCDPVDIYGCTDTAALNYNGNATIDDGSCVYAEDCDDNLVVFTMATGQYGYEIGWTIGTDSLYFGGYSDNSITEHTLCMEDGCHDIYMMDSFGDGWNGAILTIEVNGAVYTTTLSSGSGGAFTFGVNTDDCIPADVYGCIDPEALNYNSLATMDDGSCFYENGCNCTEEYDPVCAWTYDIFSGDSIVYTFTNSCWAECSGALIAFDGPCDPLDVYGCTDPMALNYNFLATMDDGSCYYDNDSTFCAANFYMFPDSMGNNTIWAINFSTGENLDYLWDFGDGATSTDPFPMHTYDEDGPYLICLTIESIVGNMVVCEDTYCDSVGAFMFPGLVGDGVGFAPIDGFTINVIQDIADSVEELSNVQNVQVYPNPANNEVSISMDANRSETLQVKLYSINGQQISAEQWTISSGNSSKQFDLEGLDSGIYMISISG
ncbi:MAG: hypothetical protein ACI84C_001653, partial [Flavobacteriales bacterium]